MLIDTIAALCDCTPETRVSHHPDDARAEWFAHQMNNRHRLHLIVAADAVAEPGTLVVTDQRGVHVLPIESRE
jgi:hypothetical protein